ncbi:MAG: S1 RNA-binding domain-containing protein [Bacillota bacterium]|jgi:S1 RNA binding domain protein|nr:S1 RNA-binding domain-containing protein [Bacillota bacterium]
MSSLQVGQVLTGEVTGITNFGAFVLLPTKETGLVHISEVADSFVRDINDYLQLNQEVKVKVISISEGKIGLSIRRANESQRDIQKAFEDRLSKFIKESEERQSDLRRKTDNKRGGRGGRRNW